MRRRLTFGVIAAALIVACLATLAEAFPKQCLCRICYFICAKPDKPAQPFVMDLGKE